MIVTDLRKNETPLDETIQEIVSSDSDDESGKEERLEDEDEETNSLFSHIKCHHYP